MTNPFPDLRSASFRGVRFWVETEGASGGRRVSVQHTAHGEQPVTEDFGAATLELPQTIYLAQENVHAEGRRLMAALLAPGAARLELPMQRPMMVHCLTADLSREKDRYGFVGYDVEFTPAGQASGAGAGIGVNGALQALRSIGQSIAARFT